MNVLQDYKDPRIDYPMDFVEREKRPKANRRQTPPHVYRQNRARWRGDGMQRRRNHRIAW